MAPRGDAHSETWLCCQTQSGREPLQAAVFARVGVISYLPLYSHHVTTKYTSYSRQSALFPGYLFAAPDEQGWARLKSLECAVKPRWLDWGRGPIQIPLELIEEIRAREENGLVKLDRVQAYDLYALGDEIQVTGGPFRDYRGLFVANANKRLVTLRVLSAAFTGLHEQAVAREISVALTDTQKYRGE